MNYIFVTTAMILLVHSAQFESTTQNTSTTVAILCLETNLAVKRECGKTKQRTAELRTEGFATSPLQNDQPDTAAVTYPMPSS